LAQHSGRRFVRKLQAQRLKCCGEGYAPDKSGRAGFKQHLRALAKRDLIDRIVAKRDAEGADGLRAKLKGLKLNALKQRARDFEVEETDEHDYAFEGLFETADGRQCFGSCAPHCPGGDKCFGLAAGRVEYVLSEPVQPDASEARVAGVSGDECIGNAAGRAQAFVLGTPVQVDASEAAGEARVAGADRVERLNAAPAVVSAPLSLPAPSESGEDVDLAGGVEGDVSLLPEDDSVHDSGQDSVFGGLL
jgi:hypothetical protein